MKAFWLFISLLVAGSQAGAADQFGLSAGQDGQLLLNGRNFHGVGVNYYDAFARTLAVPSRTNYDASFRELARRGIPFARFSAGGYWPVDWGLYRTNRAEYFARLDAVVRSAERHGIGLIPSFFWLTSTVPDLVGEPGNQWGNSGSKTHAFMRDYTRELVTRYRSFKAIWAWEFGNEYNLPADLPNASDHRPPIQPQLGTPAMRTAGDDLTHDAIRIALTEFAREVRRHDGNRLIISGNAFPRTSAWHQQHEQSWVNDTPEQFAEMAAADNPDPINSLSVRLYDSSDGSRLAEVMALSRRLKKPLFVGEFGVPGTPTEATRLAFKKEIDLLARENVPLAALWVFDFDGQADEWSVTSTNARAEQLEAVARLNRRLQQQP